MTQKQRAQKITAVLRSAYPVADCSLFSGNAFELLVAVRLSAQCTDKRVNLVTPALFKRYPALDDYARADITELEQLIHSCGFWRTKAADIIGMAKAVRDEYGGVVPDTIDELVKLPGVGRKTANLIVGDVYGKPAVVCDTHVLRVTNRLGLINTKDPYKAELKLRELLEPEQSNAFCHRIVLHGRQICTAAKPGCTGCPVFELCERNEYTKK